MHPPRTPAASDRYGARPLTQVPLRHFRTRTPTMPTRYRQTPNADAERDYCGYAHERRQISRARTTRPDVTTATVTMTATVTATVVANRVSCDELLSRRRTAERRMPTKNDMTARRHARVMSSRARGDCGT